MGAQSRLDGQASSTIVRKQQVELAIQLCKGDRATTVVIQGGKRRIQGLVAAPERWQLEATHRRAPLGGIDATTCVLVPTFENSGEALGSPGELLQ